MNVTWNDFLKQAQEIHPAFSNEYLLKVVLKSRGETSYKPEYSYRFIQELKSLISGWQVFLQHAEEIDKEFGEENTVAKILKIPWYP